MENKRARSFLQARIPHASGAQLSPFSPRLYREVFQRAHDAVTVIDVRARRHVEVNPAACSLTGYSRRELLALDPVALAAEPQRFMRLLHRGRRGMVVEARRILLRKDGAHVPVEARLSMLPNGRSALVLAVMRDISRLVEAQKVQAAHQRTNFHADFVATVSHELRTPIAAIKGAAETLIAGALRRPKERRTFVGMIHRQAGHLHRSSMAY